MGSSYSAVSAKFLLISLMAIFTTVAEAHMETGSRINTTYFQDGKPVKTRREEVPVIQKPEIKEVPKSRKQMKPAVVVKPKVKPIKIIRPKIKKH
jgi:hypothetical protein